MSKMMYMDQEYSGLPAVVQSDWNETNTESPAYIKHKPNITISTAAPTSADGNNGDIWFVYSL